MNLQEFRTQYPEYNSIPDDELTRRLYAKHYATKLSWNDFHDKFVGAPPPAEEPVAATPSRAADIGHDVESQAAQLGSGVLEVPKLVASLGEDTEAPSTDTGLSHVWAGVKKAYHGLFTPTGVPMTDPTSDEKQAQLNSEILGGGAGIVKGAGETMRGITQDAFGGPVTQKLMWLNKKVYGGIGNSKPVIASQDWLNKKSDEAIASMSPDYQMSIAKSAVDQDENGQYHPGTGLEDPMWWLHGGINMGVQMPMMLAPPAISARVSYGLAFRDALASKVVKDIPQSEAIAYATKQAEKAGVRSAVITGGLTEGVFSGAQDAQQTEQTINQIDEETLLHYEPYRELREHGMTHEQARAVVARSKALAVGIGAATAVGLTGAPLNAWIGKWATVGLHAGRLKTALQGAGLEAGQEFVQGGAEQLIQNKAEQPIDQKDTWDQVLNQAVSGGLIAGVFGGAEGALAGHGGHMSEDQQKKAEAVQAAKAEYAKAQQNLDTAETQARDPNVRLKYDDLIAARKAHQEATVGLAQAMLDSGHLDKKTQQTVAQALHDARAAGVEMPEETNEPGSAVAATPLSNEDKAQHDALTAISRAEPVTAEQLHPLVAAGMVKVSSEGQPVLLPAGRRQQKALDAKVVAAEQQSGEKATEEPAAEAPIPAAAEAQTQPSATLSVKKKRTPSPTISAAKAIEVMTDKVPTQEQLDQAEARIKVAEVGGTDTGHLREALQAAQQRKVEGDASVAAGMHKNTISTALKLHNETGGFTVNPKTGKPQKSGWAFAPSKDTEKVFDHVPTPEEVSEYAKSQKAMLSKPNHFLGGWKDGARHVLDVSQVNADRGVAEAQAAKANQDAIFNLGTMETVYKKDFAQPAMKAAASARASVRATNDVRATSYNAATAKPFGMTEAQIKAEAKAEKKGKAVTPEQRKQMSRQALLDFLKLKPASKTIRFRHFSPTKAAELELNPNRQGTGLTGAERERGGEKVISFYGEHGKVEPELKNHHEYHADIPESDLYNASEDPLNLREKSNVPVSFTLDDNGKMVPSKEEFDFNRYEKNIKKAGFKGYYMPEAKGILRGQARMFVKTKVTNSKMEKAALQTRASKKAKPTRHMQVEEALQHVAGLLTPQEKSTLHKATARKLASLFAELPSDKEMAAVAIAGQAKRGWCERSSKAIVNVFGPDAPRFAGLLAALSPQTSVEQNFKNAVAVFTAWDKAGRPQTRAEIVKVMKASVFPGNNRLGKYDVLPAWINNSVRALTSENPDTVTLSGPKVDSFAANLRGETNRVTLDAWMANFANVDQTLFSGSLTKSGPGTRPGYLAFTARVRQAADRLTQMTGQTWTPAEVQETVWSWAKTLYEHADSYKGMATAKEILDSKELTDELINATPDFVTQFADPVAERILREAGYGDRLDELTGKESTAGNGAEKVGALAGDSARLRRAAGRLDALREKREAQAAENRTAARASVKARPGDLLAPNGKPSKLSPQQHAQVRTPEFKAWFGDWEKFADNPSGVWADGDKEVSKVVDENGEPLVVYHATTNAGFREFEGALSARRTGAMFFTPDFLTMSTYMGMGGREAELDALPHNGYYPVFLNIRDPLEDDFGGANWDGSREHQYQVYQDLVPRTYFNDMSDELPNGKRNVFADEESAQAAANEVGGKVGKGLDLGNTTDQVVRGAKKYGQDGAIIRDVIDQGPYSRGDWRPTDVFAAFKPEQVKSATQNVGTFSPTNADIAASIMDRNPPFFSRATQAAENLMMKSAPGSQWLATLKNQAGVKQEELDYMGLPEWLEGQDKVSKDDLLNFMRANELRIEEVELGEKQPAKYGRYAEQGGHGYRELLLTLPRSAAESEPVERAKAYADEMDALASVEELKHRELLHRRNNADTQQERDDLNAQLRAQQVVMKQAGERALNARGVWWGLNRTAKGTQFLSSHFEEIPNVLAHVRFTERMDEDGKPLLFIEEVQSDWHQLGRKHGYGSAMPGSSEHGKLVPDAPFKTSWPELSMKRMIRYAAENGFSRIGWTTGQMQTDRYALSRHIDKAVWSVGTDNKYGSFAAYGKNGEAVIRRDGITEAELEELIGKDVAKRLVAQEPTTSAYAKKKYDQAFMDAKGALEDFYEQQSFATDQQIPKARRAELQSELAGVVLRNYLRMSDYSQREYFKDIVYPDRVKQLMEDANAAYTDYRHLMGYSDGTNLHTLSGMGLNIGGEGMRGFYDNVLPATMNKYLKKWGVKVGQTRFETGTITPDDNGIRTVHSIDLTDKMQESAFAGQPLFSLGQPGPNVAAHQLKVVQDVAKEFNKALGVQVIAVGSPSELPPEGQLFDPNDLEGLYVPDPDAPLGGRIYIVGNNIADRQKAIETAAHEAVGHLGLRALLGDKMNDVMDELYQSFPHGVIAAAKRNDLDINHPNKYVRLEMRRTAAEEMVAYAAGRLLSTKGVSVERTTWQKIVDYVRDALKKLGVLKGWSNDDVVALIHRSRDYVRDFGKKHQRDRNVYTGNVNAAASKKGRPLGSAPGNQHLDSFLSKIGSDRETLGEKWKRFKSTIKDRIEMSVFDQFHGIVRAANLAGVSLGDAGYYNARLSSNSAELVQSMMEYGHPVWNGDAPDVAGGMGFLEILKPLGDKVNPWLAYMVARRAQRLAGEGRENLFTSDEIKAALDLGKQNPEFDVVAEKYAAFQKKVLDFAQQAGIINPDSRALWENQDYIPFHRLVENGEVQQRASAGALGRIKNQIVQLKGGKANLGDPMENITRNWLALMDASIKAHAARNVVDGLNGTGLVSQTPIVNQVVPAHNVKSFVKANPTLVASLKSVGVDINKLTPQQLRGLQTQLAVPPPAEEGTISIWRNGQREHWAVHDEMLFQSLQGLKKSAWSPLMELLRAPKRLLTATVTITPQFLLKNVWRDMWHTFIVGTHDGKTIVPIKDTIKGTIDSMKMDQTAQSMLAGGGSFAHGWIYGGDTAAGAAAIRRTLRAHHKGTGIILDTPLKAFRFYRKLQNASENANRVAIYRKSLQSGKARSEALYEARDIMDFSMQGASPVIQFLVQSVPFFNARLQGLYRIGRGITKKTALSIFMRGALLSILSLAILARNWRDDRYKALSDDQKSNYWHLWDVFQKGDHWQIPKPFETGAVFGTVPEVMGDAFLTNQDEPDRAAQAANLMLYTVGQQLNMSPQPAAIWPIVELATNKNSYTGAPILTEGDQGVLPEDQVGPNSSPTYREIAQHMPSFMPEALRSPKQLEFLARAYIGNVQDYALLASDFISREINGEAAPPKATSNDWPGLRDFRKIGPATHTKYADVMYDIADQATKVYQSRQKAINADTDEGDARAQQIDDENQQLLDVRTDFQKAAKAVSDLKKQQRQIQLDPNMEPDEKRSQIDELQEEINDTARDVYDLRPGGKLNPKDAAQLINATPQAQSKILRGAGLPATADLVNQSQALQ